jgi:truncated hemoglobin YjbI
MQTVFEAAGGMEGMRRLAEAWHVRVMADEVVAHAFSHGFQPDHVERWRLTGRRHWAGRRRTRLRMATRRQWCGCTAAMESTRR